MHPEEPHSGHEIAGHEIAGHEIAGHEIKDARVTPIVLTGIALAITAAIVLSLSIGLFHFFAAHSVEAPPNPMAGANAPFPPVPRIEEHPAIELEQLHAQEEQVLTTYGWADKKSGAVRIPIERAMELQLERGFPTGPQQRPQK